MTETCMLGRWPIITHRAQEQKGTVSTCQEKDIAVVNYTDRLISLLKIRLLLQLIYLLLYTQDLLVQVNMYFQPTQHSRLYFQDLAGSPYLFFPPITR